MTSGTRGDDQQVAIHIFQWPKPGNLSLSDLVTSHQAIAVFLGRNHQCHSESLPRLMATLKRKLSERLDTGMGWLSLTVTRTVRCRQPVAALIASLTSFGLRSSVSSDKPLAYLDPLHSSSMMTGQKVACPSTGCLVGDRFLKGEKAKNNSADNTARHHCRGPSSRSTCAPSWI